MELGMTDDTFNAVVCSKGDFEFNDEYNNATPEQKVWIWNVAKSKLPDMLMGNLDYESCLQYCIDKVLKN